MVDNRQSNAAFLSKYFSGPPPRVKGAATSDIANLILLNASRDLPVVKSSNEGEGNEPSLMGRIFDILSRPNYAIAELVNSGGNVERALEGFAGKRKTTFSDVLRDKLGITDPVMLATGGFALDVALDPTTYIPSGLMAKGVKGVGKLAKGKKGAEAAVDVSKMEKTLAQRLLDKGDPVNPSVYNLPINSVNKQIPKALRNQPSVEFPRSAIDEEASIERPDVTISDVTPGQLELPLEGNLPKGTPKVTSSPEIRTSVDAGEEVAPVKGQQALRFPGLNVTKTRQENASKIIGRVVDGDPEALQKLLPTPKSKADRRDIEDASNIISGWNPAKATADLNKRYPETLNAKQQVRLYYKAREAARKRFKNPNSPANAGRIDNIALKIYSATEGLLEDAGFVPRLGNGENAKLSEVLAATGGTKAPGGIDAVLREFGDALVEGSPAWQAVESIRARGAVKDSVAAKEVLDAVSDASVETRVNKLLSDAQISETEKLVKRFGQAAARAKDMSPAAISTMDGLLTRALTAGKSPALIAVERQGRILNDIIAGGKKRRPEVNAALTRGLEEDLGKCPKWAQHDNKAVEFLMGRVATWWGQRDLRPLSLNAIGSASATAQARGKALDDLFKPFNQQQRYEALRLAQGYGAPTSEGTYQLATQVKRMMENLAGQAAGQSVITRSAVDMDMLNKWMDRYKVGFRFSNKKLKNVLGETVDYSQGTDWVNSWKAFSPTEDPKIFLFKINEAIEQATREKALFDEIGERFGARVPGKGWRSTVDHPYLRDYYFTDDICKQLPRLIKDWSVGDWNAASNNPLLRLYDRVLSMWKSGVTIYRPGHHIRNMIGDIYLGWMDGVNSVRPYTIAARVQRVLKDSYADLQDVDRLVELGVLSKQYGTPQPGEVIFRNKSGVEFTADQIAAVAHSKGLLEHARTIEDIIDLGEGSRFQPFGGRVQAVARGASELQSHNARLAHFIDKVMKSKGNDLESIFEDAARRARKWHPSGLDLTDFERKTMRRIIPFYSWIRKSTPLLIEGLVMNPGKSVLPSKLFEAIQTSQGIDTPGRHDPFPVDQMFPEWLRAYGIGPISTGDGFLGRFSDQTPPGYVMGGMGLNPLSDLVAQSETPGKTILTSLTPAVGIPLELLQGQKMFTGEPLYGPDARPGAMEQYVGEQIPIWSAIQGLTGVTPFGTETRAFEKSDQAGRQAFVNWLTGGGVRGTGPYVRQARYEKKAPLITQQRANKENFLAELRKQLEG